jgi:hypothetical protein
VTVSDYLTPILHAVVSIVLVVAYVVLWSTGHNGDALLGLLAGQLGGLGVTHLTEKVAAARPSPTSAVPPPPSPPPGVVSTAQVAAPTAAHGGIEAQA